VSLCVHWLDGTGKTLGYVGSKLDVLASYLDWIYIYIYIIITYNII
jgi:hypothetical protein